MNPFNYQGPLDAAVLIDRRAELDALQRAAADGIAIRLAAPRRFGKTTLLDAHVGAMRAVGHRAVRVDLSRVATVGDAAARVAAAYAGLPDDPRRTRAALERAPERRRQARPADRRNGAAGGAPGRRRGAHGAARSCLDVPRALHEADDGLTVVCFDEFQDLLLADDALDGLVRSVIQHHARAAAYVFAGSEPSLMRALFADRERPFYGQARPLDLPELPVAEAAGDVARVFAAHGLADVGAGAVDEVVAFTRGHPQRTILVAHHLFDVLDRGEDVDDPALTAVERALTETRDGHQATWDALGRAERLVCIALADGQAPSGSRMAEEHRIARSTLAAALDRLAAEEHQVRRDADGRPYLLDPLFAEWLRRR